MTELKKRQLLSGQIPQILRAGKRRHSKHLSVFFILAKSSEWRYQIIVSSKQFPTAVSRNRMKRRIREIMRKAEECPGKLALLIPKASALSLSVTELQAEINALLVSLRRVGE